MQFTKRSCDEGLQSYGHFCVIENERIFTFQAFVKKTNHLAGLDD